MGGYPEEGMPLLASVDPVWLRCGSAEGSLPGSTKIQHQTPARILHGGAPCQYSRYVLCVWEAGRMSNTSANCLRHSRSGHSMGPWGPQGPHAPGGGASVGPMGPQGPHENTGAFLRGAGALLRGRGGRGRHGGGLKPAGCAIFGRTQNPGAHFWAELKFWDRPRKKVMKKKSRDLANPDPPALPGLHRHFLKLHRGRSVEQFDEL